METTKFNQWWRELTPTQQRQLHGLGAGDPLPAALVPSLVRYRGSVVPAEWWDSEHGSAGFPLPADVHQLVHAHERASTADAG